MKTLHSILQEKAFEAISKAFEKEFDVSIAEVTISTQEIYGHYQCNSSLKLAKILNDSPRKIAIRIIENFDRYYLQTLFIEDLQIAGPGFINITIHPQFLSSYLQKVLSDSHLGVDRPSKQRIIVEFSSPNIAKELHVGHLRSTIIGDCLARLFEFFGHDVIRLNHIGDWGTQFGMLIAYMKDHVPEVLKGESHPDLYSLMQWYKASKKRFDEYTDFRKKAQQKVVELQSGNKEALFAWKIICDISRKGFEEIYHLLDVKLSERGESFYNPFLPKLIEELEQKGLIEISDGAKCIFIEGFKNREGKPLPLMVQKTDGGYNYDTTDMAALRYRIFEDRADRIIIVTDSGQSTHFQMIFEAGKKAGYLDERKVQLDHVPFGLVLNEDKKKFKTREGDVEKLIDLLKEAVVRSKEILIARLPVLDMGEIEELAKILGIDAIKYADLSCHRQKDYIFSYDRMLQFEGNTAAFLLYAYVRILGIKRKTKVDMEEVLSKNQIDLNHPSEISLGLHLLRFGEVLDHLSKELLPNRLCDYLYELAEKFHGFFRDCRVEGTDEMGSRLVLCEICARILKQGLEILGLKTMDRM